MRTDDKRKLGNNYRHGETLSLLNRVWISLRQRCKNPNDTSAKRYLARGISVCAEWEDYRVFRDWALSNGYKHGLTIDRIDNSGNYEPSNCRFVDKQAQANNRRSNHRLTIFGETKTIAEWSRDERCAVPMMSLYMRLWEGWAEEEAVMLPRYARRNKR